MKKKFRINGYIIATLIALVIFTITKFSPNLQNFTSPEFVRDYLLGFGNFGYIMYVILILFSIPLPIPSTPIILAGGYIYGMVLGTILALIGAVIGGTIAFYLVRIYGKPFLEKLVDKHHINHFNHIFQKRGSIAALISYAIPLFPSDTVNLILGLTRMKYLTFLFLVIIGHIPRYLIVNSLGEDLYTGFTIKTLLALILGAIFILIAIFRKSIQRFMFKELRELEDEAKYVGEKLGLMERSKRKVREIKKKVKKRIKKHQKK